MCCLLWWVYLRCIGRRERNEEDKNTYIEERAIQHTAAHYDVSSLANLRHSSVSTSIANVSRDRPRYLSRHICDQRSMSSHAAIAMWCNAGRSKQCWRAGGRRRKHGGTDGQSTLSESGRHATGGSLAGVRRVCVCACVWGKAFFVWCVHLSLPRTNARPLPLVSPPSLLSTPTFFLPSRSLHTSSTLFYIDQHELLRHRRSQKQACHQNENRFRLGTRQEDRKTCCSPVETFASPQTPLATVCRRTRSPTSLEGTEREG